jgi:sialate O-acetylesterase
MLLFKTEHLTKMMQRAFGLIGFICLSCNVINAQLKPAGIFGNNAILQEGNYIPIWGVAAPSALVKVSFAQDSTQVFADKNGKWLVYLPPMEADGKSYRLYIKSGHEEIIYNNVMLGEVWLASGQSNMEKTIGSGVGAKTNQIIADANYPNIRYFQVPRQTSRTPLENFSGNPQWIKITPETVKTLSAVAYFFGRELHLNKKVPVGIISSSWGATSAEAWISEKMLSTMPDFSSAIQNIDHNRQHWDAFVAQNLKADHDRDSIAKISNNGLKLKVNTLAYNDSLWTKTQYPLDMQKVGLNGFWGIVWFRKSFNLPEKPKGKTFKITLNMTARDVVIYLNGIQIGHTINPDSPMNYTITGKLLKKGKNLLALRMYVNWGSAYIGTPQTQDFIF